MGCASGYESYSTGMDLGDVSSSMNYLTCPTLENEGEACFSQCSKSGNGYCDLCGSGGMCCHKSGKNPSGPTPSECLNKKHSHKSSWACIPGISTDDETYLDLNRTCKPYASATFRSRNDDSCPFPLKDNSCTFSRPRDHGGYGIELT